MGNDYSPVDKQDDIPIVLSQSRCYARGMKRDGRGFDHQTLEAIRLMAVERLRGGERPSSVVTSFGFHRTAIHKWLKAASRPGVGLKFPPRLCA